MKNKLLFGSLVVAILVGGFRLTNAQSFSNSLQKIIDELARRVTALEERVVALQEELRHIQLTPGPQGPQGPAGPMGPQGEPGQDAQHGAGVVAFADFDYTAVLKTDGAIWQHVGAEWIQSTNNPTTVPVPITDIVEWRLKSFLDKNGNMWIWDNWGQGWMWHNIGHP